jgi:hypothetical protein
MDLIRLDEFLRFIAERLSAPDYSTAETLLYAAVDRVYGASLHRDK